jgi:hypothetical protein
MFIEPTSGRNDPNRTRNSIASKQGRSPYDQYNYTEGRLKHHDQQNQNLMRGLFFTTILTSK